MFYKPGSHKEKGFRHDPFKAFVSPRPIGWISTINASGQSNLAPYSFFNAVCADPPCVIFGSGGRTDGSGKKDSQINAETTGEFVCSIVSQNQREAMNQTSIHLPYGENEMPSAGLEGEPSRLVKPLRVKGAPVHLECKYMQSVEMPCWQEGRENWVIFGEVIGIHVDPVIVKDGMVDVTSYQPVSRLGYMDYSTVTQVFQMERPD
ncbi:MAG: flavin reductase [Rhodospirillaceae bacterium]|nr:flavin reductase [Rhodospirillaceae bacterium]|tara:strand:- start:2526 stop:3143 length:618 start_codon:yes stop_codon:yes gene_type:complete